MQNRNGLVAWIVGIFVAVLVDQLLQSTLTADRLVRDVLAQSFAFIAAVLVTWPLHYQGRVQHTFLQHVAYFAAPVFLIATLRLALRLG